MFFPWPGAWIVEAIDGDGFPVQKVELPVESHIAVPWREPYCPREVPERCPERMLLPPHPSDPHTASDLAGDKTGEGTATGR